MCIRIVPVVRGDMLIGGMWQREQFISNSRSPSFCLVAAGPGFGFPPPVPAQSKTGNNRSGRAANHNAARVRRDIISSPAKAAI